MKKMTYTISALFMVFSIYSQKSNMKTLYDFKAKTIDGSVFDFNTLKGKKVLIVNTASAKDAVHSAFHFANKGDVVLLSPACASFDLFKNYEDRGQQFKDAVKEL